MARGELVMDTWHWIVGKEQLTVDNVEPFCGAPFKPRPLSRYKIDMANENQKKYTHIAYMYVVLHCFHVVLYCFHVLFSLTMCDDGLHLECINTCSHEPTDL